MPKQNDVDESQTRYDGLTTFESKLLKVLALHLVQERQQSDQIDLLYRAGFKPTEIAGMVGTTANTVNVLLSKQRAAKKKKRVKRGK
jgi:DNA-directed RNA polymerase specialized sigma24 family protein